MKLLGNLLLTVSLIAGMISAATAYVGFLDEPAEDLAEAFVEEGEPIRLKAAAGAVPSTEAGRAELRARYASGELSAEAYVAALRSTGPVLAAGADEGGTRLTAERLAKLQTEGVGTVFTKSFSLGRWRYAWVFALSAVGLLCGSLMVRTADKREIQAATAAAADSAEASPERALEALGERLALLRRDLVALPEEDRLRVIGERIDRAQRELVTPFVDGRALLVAKLGLGGYAELMDRFAAGERQLNRAWSAAADGVLAESEECLATAEEWLAEAQERLVAGRGPS